MRHKSKKNMSDKEKQQQITMMVMHNLEKNMKESIKELRSLKPAVIKASAKYQRLVEKYKVVNDTLLACESQRDQLLLKLSKSQLNKESVKNDTPALPS